jgi:hypothetical protein
MTSLGRQRQSEIATRPFGPLAMTSLGRQRQSEIATRPFGLLAMTNLGRQRQSEIAARPHGRARGRFGASGRGAPDARRERSPKRR